MTTIFTPQQLLDGLLLIGKDISYAGDKPCLSNAPMMLAWGFNTSRRKLHPEIQLSFAGFTLLNTDPDISARWEQVGEDPWGVTGTGSILFTTEIVEYFGLDTSQDVIQFPEELAVPFMQKCIDQMSELFTLDAPALTGMVGKELRRHGPTYWATGLSLAVPCSKEKWDQGHDLVKIHAEAANAFVAAQTNKVIDEFVSNVTDFVNPQKHLH